MKRSSVFWSVVDRVPTTVPAAEFSATAAGAREMSVGGALASSVTETVSVASENGIRPTVASRMMSRV